MSQTLTDDSEVVFKQPGKTAEAMEQEGLIPSRHKEETGLEDTKTSRWDPTKSDEIRPASRRRAGSRFGRSGG